MAAAVAALALTGGCATKPKTDPDPASLSAFFAALTAFADRQTMTAATVRRIFEARLAPSDSPSTQSFLPLNPEARYPVDLLELSTTDAGVQLDLFLGGRCITLGEVEGEYGKGGTAAAIPDFGGSERAYQLPATAHGRPTGLNYQLAFEFLGAGRCVTQITISHQPLASAHRP